MFAIGGHPIQGISRRELLRVGGANMLGLSLPMFLRAQADAALTPSADPTFGRAKNVIFLYLGGGPPQHETFDPKPQASAEIRGSFKPIHTNVPGIDFCELLPRTARIADKLAVCRAMVTNDNVHSSSGYWILTGYKHDATSAREVKPTDWPCIASVVKKLRPSDTAPFDAVWLPEPIIANPNVVLSGQNGGFLGRLWDPELFRCDPNADDFKIDEFTLPGDVSPLRLTGRRSLLEQVDRHFRSLERGAAVKEYGDFSRDAFGVLSSGKTRNAFAIEQETQKNRDRYGRSKWGQSVLLARRLIEAGVRMVHVNWPREPGDLSVNNPLWDTHAQNDERLKGLLCPQFDVGFTALIEDLAGRGLLDETLVVAVGEFGRTPKFNKNAGRDHWGHVFSLVMAGAGISAGQVYGSSDRQGAFPKTGKIEPQDLSATIFHLLGIGHDATFLDRENRPSHVTEGTPIFEVLGTAPATTQRRAPGGAVTSIPDFQKRQLVNLGFDDDLPLSASLTSQKQWQAFPLWMGGRPDAFSVRRITGSSQTSRSGESHVAIGLGMGGGQQAVLVPPGARCVLAQQIRNPRPGRFTVSIHASAVGGKSSQNLWRENFRSRLVIFGFTDKKKQLTRFHEFASVTIQPPFAAGAALHYGKFSVSAVLQSQNNGADQLGRGIGFAVIVEKTSSGMLHLPAGAEANQAWIRLDDVGLEFVPV